MPTNESPFGAPQPLPRDLEGFRLEVFGEVSSTNQLLKTRAQAGEPEGLVFTAARQIQGRGQRQRVWESPVGGLWMSVLFRPRISPQEVLEWMPETGARIQTMLKQEAGLEATVKFPNDILVRGKKLCGILAEAESYGGEPHPRFVVLGIGLNVENPLPPDLEATSLAHENIPWTIPQTRDQVLRVLAPYQTK